MADVSRSSREDGEAVDILCPHCGEKPIEGASKVRRVTGFLLGSRRTVQEVYGCRACLQAEHRSAFVKNLLLGWWSISAFVFNACFYLWQSLYRWLAPPRGNSALFEGLEERGLSYEVLGSREAFDPAGKSPGELFAQPIAKLGALVALSDGDLADEEVDRIHQGLASLFPDYRRSSIVEVAEELKADPLGLETLCSSLEDHLSPEGKKLALAIGVDVASADGQIEDGEVDTLWDSAQQLGLGQHEIEQVLGHAGGPSPAG